VAAEETKPAEVRLVTHKDGTFSRTIRLWANKAAGAPFLADSFEWEFVGVKTLTEGAGLTVTPGREAEGDEPAEPTVITAYMSPTETAVVDAAQAHHRLSWKRGEDKDFLLVGSILFEEP
jgi:hypothetical protein